MQKSRDKQPLPEAGSNGCEPVAIIGMACRLPGAVSDPRDLWRVLQDGVDAVEVVPKERWDADDFYDPTARIPGKMATRWGGFIHGADRFDARFFRIAPREALCVDPQQRLLLELSWELFESAAIVPARLSGSQTGVFVGINFDDYQWVDNCASHASGVRSLGTWAELDGYTGTGIARSIASGRISYTFGLEGPSVTLDTACSSSLVAVHQACQALRLGECDLALAGGATLLLTPTAYIDFSHMTGLARDGRCKPFAAAADGLTWADGAGLVLVKRLRDALADGDPIRAVIRGSAVNQDGRSRNLTAPSERAQQRVIARALAAAQVGAHEVSYVEAHGTGTPLGDPIEIRALGSALGRDPQRSQPLWVGSLKSNLGHTQAAAGVAGLIKSVLALENELIPASLHCTQPNPQIGWGELGVQVANRALPWPRSDVPRIAGVSSFGFSGTNAHMIVQEAPPSAAVASALVTDISAPQLLTVSGHNPAALREQADRLARRLCDEPELRLADVALTLNRHRTHHRCRAACVATDVAMLRPILEAIAAGRAHPACKTGEADTLGKVVFVFPGAGSQWPGMGRALLAQVPVFAARIDEIDVALQQHSGWSVRDVLLERPGAPSQDRVDIIQPTLFAMAVALAETFRHFGVEPAAVVGHSQGEIAAACVSGALSLADAARVVVRRSQLLCSVIGRGGMAAVELSAGETSHFLAERKQLSIAAINTERSTIVSGDSAAIDDLLAELAQAGVFSRRIKVDFASHSPQMDPLHAQIVSALSGVQPRAGSIPIYSTVRAAALDGSQLDAGYWADNLRQPVRFSDALQQLVNDGHRFFVELSPHPLLTGSMEPVVTAESVRGVVVGSLRREQGGCDQLLTTLAALHVRGFPLAWQRLSTLQARPVALPTYAFQRERFWLERKPPSFDGARADQPNSPMHPLLGRRFTMSVPAGVHYWERRLSLHELPYLADHRVGGAILLPVAAVLEMSLAAGRELLGDGPLVIERLQLLEAVVLPDARDVAGPLLQLSLSEQRAGEYRLELCSRSDPAAATTAAGWRTHASASLRRAEPLELSEQALDAAALRDVCRDELPVEQVYARLEAAGVAYGPAFRGLAQVRVAECEAVSQLQLPAAAGQASAYGVHPCLLDAAMQALAVTGRASRQITGSVVPVAIGKVLSFGRAEAELQSFARLDFEAGTADGLHATLAIADQTGAPVMQLHGLELRVIGQRDALEALQFAVTWRADSAPRGALEGTGNWLLLADRSGFANELERALTARGAQVFRLASDACAPGLHEPAAEPGLPVVLRALLERHAQWAGIVHMWGLDAEPLHSESALDVSALATCAGLLQLVQGLAGCALRDQPRLALVTRQAQQIEAAEHVRPEQTLLWGMAGTIAAEHPEWRTLRVDVSAQANAVDASLLTEALLAGSHAEANREDQLALRHGQRYVPRLIAAPRHAVSARGGVRSDRSYLITGGLGGLGLACAAWLAEQGAGRVILVSRGAASSSEQRAALQALEQTATRTLVARCDVADRAALAALLDRVAAEGPPLAGIVHAAGVVSDGWLANQTMQSFAKVFAPKVAGAFHLHALTRHLELDFFVLYSSLAALLGPPGLANYAAANAFMDGLARLRRAQGLVASSINWGPFDAIGMASSATHRAASVQHRGMHNLTLAEGRQIFQRALAHGASSCVAARIDLRQWLESAPQLATWPFVSELKANADSAAPHAALLDRTLLALLSEQAAEQAVWTLLESVNRHLAEVLRVEVAQLGDPRTPFMELGLESLMALELRNRLESTLGVRLSTTLLYAHPNALALCRELLPRLTGAAGLDVGRNGFAATAANGGGFERRLSDAADDAERDSIDSLSDAELLRVVEELSA